MSIVNLCKSLLPAPGRLQVLIGFGSWFDPSGKVAALAGGLALTASALSPIVGGVIVDILSAKATGWTCAILAVAAIIAFLPIAISERKHRRSASADPMANARQMQGVSE